MGIPAGLQQQIQMIAADQVSGATSLLLRALETLERASHDRTTLQHAAAALCRAQPSMAGFHTAAALALAAEEPAAEVRGLLAKVRRSPAAIARFAVPILRLRTTNRRPLRLATCSRSAAVEQALADLGAIEPLQVCCAESLPGGEGRALAQALASRGYQVELYTDAGLSTAIPGVDALLVGADAVSPGSFINKAGTAALAALAQSRGIPVLVLAGRDKVLPREIFDTLPIREGRPSGDTAGTTAGPTIRMPLFERVSPDLSAQLVTDRGILLVEAAEAMSLWSPAAVSAYMSVIG